VTESRQIDHDQETLEALLPRLLAARLGVTPEELAALDRGERPAFADREVSNSLLVAALVSTLGGPRPIPDADSQTDPIAEIERLERALGAARRRIAELERDHDSARALLEYIGGVVGACPACLGRNRLCLRCHGAGVPGKGDPMQDDLLAFVRAPLRRLGFRITSFER
jgi:hypothetical protein